MAKRTIMSGGGINSRVVKHDRKGKQEPVTHKANVPGVAQQGLAVAFKKSPLQQGPHSGYETKPQGSTGIANVRQGHAGVGPGGGNRQIFPSGSQSPTPSAKQVEKGSDILSQFGPERSMK